MTRAEETELKVVWAGLCLHMLLLMTTVRGPTGMPNTAE